MDININETGNCKKEMVATLTYDELTPYFEKAVLDFRKKANIPGFRKGKAPVQMIKKVYEPQIEYSAIEDIADDVFRKYYLENKINVYGSPELQDIDYKPKESLMFKVGFSFIPKVELKGYKNLEVTKRIIKPDNSLIDNEYLSIMNQHAELVMDGQVMDDNYLVTLDFQDLDENGEIVIGKVTKDQKLYLNNPRLAQNLKDVLKDIREGETKLWEYTIDEKPVKTQITCTKIEKLVFPEINNEFLKKVTNQDDLNTEEDLKKHIEKGYADYFESQSRQELEGNLIREIVQANDVNIPDKLVDNVLQQNFEKYQQQHEGHEHSHHDHEHLSKEEFFNREKADTVLYLKWTLIKEEIIKAEKIEIQDSDILAFAEKTGKQYGIEPEKLMDIYKKNDDINFRLLDQKLMDLLISESVVKEKVISNEPEDEIESDTIPEKIDY